MQYRNPDNFDLVMEALQKAHRMDLVGFDDKCLIRPRKLSSEKKKSVNTGKTEKSSKTKAAKGSFKKETSHSNRCKVQKGKAQLKKGRK